MLLIPCPWCGPRSQVEFTYGGDATVERPPADAPEQAWFEYVYLRDNPRGPGFEDDAGRSDVRQHFAAHEQTACRQSRVGRDADVH